MRILVVEDDAELADAIRRGLHQHGFAVDVAVDGQEALNKVVAALYDGVVLDRDLPVIHGDEVCRRLAATAGSPPVLMLTAAGSLTDRVDGLQLGADDYLPKPFAMVELVARLRAVTRRPRHALPPVLRAGDLEVDPARRRVSRGGRPVVLTNKEFGVLETLLGAAGAVVSAEELLERVWDEHADPFTNAVRVTMVTLRRKLGEPPVIETVTKAGYRVVVP